MEELIGSVVSLIILVPIIYFLPLGLSKKGKGLVILIAFLFANLGMLAKSIFHIWQTALILLLLTILTVYILDKRLNKQMFLNSALEKEDEFLLEDLEAKSSVDNRISTESQPELGTMPASGIVHVIEEPTIVPSEESIEIEELPFELNLVKEDLETDELEVSIPTDLDMELEDETSFLNNREELLEETSLPPVKQDDIVVNGYMSDIEKLLESEDLEEDSNFEELLGNDDNVNTDIEIIDYNDGEELEILASNDDITTEIAPTKENEFTLEHLLEDDLELEVLQLTEPKELITEVIESNIELEQDLEIEVLNFDTRLEQVELFEEEPMQLDDETENMDSISEELVSNEADLFAVLEELEEAELEVASSLSEDVHEENALNEQSLEPTTEELSLIETVEADSEALDSNQEDIENVDEEVPEIDDSNDSHEELVPVMGIEDVAITPDIETFSEENDYHEELEPLLKVEEETDLDETAEGSIAEIESSFEDIAFRKEQETGNEIVADSFVPEPEDSTAEEVAPLCEAKEETLIRQEQKSVLQQQLFHTMVSQLHLLRKQMSGDDYEKLVQEHLHPDLPVQDYYTFVSLLIEHYISRKEIGKLQELLTKLDGKFTNFPILDMEIRYLYKQYCENTR